MVSSAVPRNKLPLASILSGAVVLLALAAGFLYLEKPRTYTVQNGRASAESRAYVSNLALSDVRMHASENFMKQQVVEMEGKIANNGPRAVKSVDVYCLFRAVDGYEIYRERVPILRSKTVPVRPNESRPFRLAFDNLPDGWNQAMPNLVIAQITFAGQDK
jgi:hypothetical protein